MNNTEKNHNQREARSIASEIYESFGGILTDQEIEKVLTATAYVALVKERDSIADFDTLDDFLSKANLEEKIKDILKQTLPQYWSIVIQSFDKYDADSLRNLVLDNYLFNYRNSKGIAPTSDSVISLSSHILDIQPDDSILDICSERGTFAVKGHGISNCASYTGVDLNYNMNDIATLKGSLLGENYRFNLGNALTMSNDIKYDKIFAHYPFRIRGNDLEECRAFVKDYFKMNEAITAKCTSEWIFNAKTVSLLSEHGKAVAIMPNGGVFNMSDRYIRQFFVENGYVEAVISLPAKLLYETNIAITMIVFSHNNKFVKFVDATKNYKAGWGNNTLSKKDVEAILDMLSDGGAKTYDVSFEEIRENEYNMDALRYIYAPSVENGVRFGDVITSITRGSQIKSEELDAYKSKYPTDYRYVTISNVNNGMLEIEGVGQFLTEIPQKLSKFVIEKDSIILSKMASPTFKSAVVDNPGLPLVATSNLYVIRVNTSKVNPYYIQAFFDSKMGEDVLNRVAAGSVVKTISLDAIKNLEIPLPSLDEQNRIAAKYLEILDEYEILKRKMARVLDRRRNVINNEG